jgi:hypothetical protein
LLGGPANRAAIEAFTSGVRAEGMNNG